MKRLILLVILILITGCVTYREPKDDTPKPSHEEIMSVMSLAASEQDIDICNQFEHLRTKAYCRNMIRSCIDTAGPVDENQSSFGTRTQPRRLETLSAEVKMEDDIEYVCFGLRNMEDEDVTITTVINFRDGGSDAFSPSVFDKFTLTGGLYREGILPKEATRLFIFSVSKEKVPEGVYIAKITAMKEDGSDYSSKSFFVTNK